MGSRSGRKNRLITSAYIPEAVKVRTEDKRGNIVVIKTEYKQRKQRKRVYKGKARKTNVLN